jgi:hypothetical protein
VNRHQNAALAATGHAPVGRQRIINEKEVAAAPAEGDGCALDHGIDAVEAG